MYLISPNKRWDVPLVRDLTLMHNESHFRFDDDNNDDDNNDDGVYDDEEELNEPAENIFDLPSTEYSQQAFTDDFPFTICSTCW